MENKNLNQFAFTGVKAKQEKVNRQILAKLEEEHETTFNPRMVRRLKEADYYQKMGVSDEDIKALCWTPSQLKAEEENKQ